MKSWCDQFSYATLKTFLCIIICSNIWANSGTRTQSVKTPAQHAKELYYSTQRIGTIEVRKTFFRALHGVANGSAYLTIAQTGDEDDTLIAAYSTACERIEIHDHIINPQTKIAEMVDIKHMRIPGRKEGCVFLGCLFAEPKPVKFKRNGKHLMLMGLAPGISNKDEIEIILEFKKAGKGTVRFISEDRVPPKKRRETS